MTISESVSGAGVIGRKSRASSSVRGQFAWRAMVPDDLEAVHALGKQVHPGYPERIEVFAERLRLYAPGCRVLEAGDAMAGYVISHPWHPMMPPKLDSLLVAMPTFPATFYIHDLALLPLARGSGAGARAVADLVDHTEAIGLADLSLVAVNASVPFWRRQGFDIVESRSINAALRSYDGEARFMMRRLPLPAED
ncbi:GNAT family N-acetyltransferase [Pseudochelatococcus sp. B33]